MFMWFFRRKRQFARREQDAQLLRRQEAQLLRRQIEELERENAMLHARLRSIEATAKLQDTHKSSGVSARMVALDLARQLQTSRHGLRSASLRAIGSSSGSGSAVGCVVPWRDVVLDVPIGVGASGAVFTAQYAKVKCAIKILHKARVNEVSKAALVEECELMLQLRHPNILQTLGLASDGHARCGILLELLHMSLAELLAAEQDGSSEHQRSLSWRSPMLSIAADVARGVAHLHGRSILHRDLKPGNVLLGPPPLYHAKMSDFGASPLRIIFLAYDDYIPGR